MGKKSWLFPTLFDSLFSEFSLVLCLAGTVAPHQRALRSDSIGSVYRAKLPYRYEVAIAQRHWLAAGGITSL